LSGQGIDQLQSFLNGMRCEPAQKVADDLRVIVVFENNSGERLEWKSSFFNYVDFQGDICRLDAAGRTEITHRLS